MFDGQSLGYTPWENEQTYPFKFMRSAHPDNRFFVCNRPGTTYATRDAYIASRVDHLFKLSKHCVLIDDGGSYEVDTANGNQNTAQTLATMAAYTAARRAAGADYIVRITIPPANIITAGEETTRQQVNAALVANPGAYGYDKVVDLRGIPELQLTNDVGWYYDGTHWTDAATTLVAKALRDAGV